MSVGRHNTLSRRRRRRRRRKRKEEEEEERRRRMEGKMVRSRRHHSGTMNALLHCVFLSLSGKTPRERRERRRRVLLERSNRAKQRS